LANPDLSLGNSFGPREEAWKKGKLIVGAEKKG